MKINDVKQLLSTQTIYYLIMQELLSITISEFYINTNNLFVIFFWYHVILSFEESITIDNDVLP
jgi:ABC-type amino acid transport system permease subunit